MVELQNFLNAPRICVCVFLSENEFVYLCVDAYYM